MSNPFTMEEYLRAKVVIDKLSERFLDLSFLPEIEREATKTVFQESVNQMAVAFGLQPVEITFVDKPVCANCGRTPDQINEYIHNEEDMDPIKFVETEEGTYNRKNKHFYCTDCYIRLGQPLGIAP